MSEQRTPDGSRANLPGWQLQEADPVNGSVSQTSSQPPFRVTQGSDQLVKLTKLVALNKLPYRVTRQLESYILLHSIWCILK